MAATSVTAMPHNLTHLPPLPRMPRIRPPRLMPGDPHPNNNPPPSDLPEEQLPRWYQGRLRKANSTALKHKKAKERGQTQKAIDRHHNQGLDIWAYFHIRTHQVVYSLSEDLQVRSGPQRPCTESIPYLEFANSHPPDY
jgi:hypothetical protein